MPDNEGLAIMNCALALPSNWDAFRQAVCAAFAIESKHQKTHFTLCLEMADAINQEAGFRQLPPYERRLFAVIITGLKAALVKKAERGS
jgi:hypothetical protein